MRWTMLILLAAALAVVGCERESPSEPILEDPGPLLSLTMDHCRTTPGWQALGFKNLGQCLRSVHTGQDTRVSFRTTWDTNLGDGTTVTLALAGEVDATIDWGDGTVTTVTLPGPHTHDYGTEGTYTVSVTGSVTAYNSHGHGGEESERSKLVSVDTWGDLGFTSLRWAFLGASNLVSVPGDTEAIGTVTDMYGMFWGATSFNGDIGGWDVSNVASMAFMFRDATSFNQAIGGWNVSDVTNMSGMFHNASSFNQPIGGWTVSNVTDMRWTFFGASAFDQDIGGWDVSNVTNMHGMFWGATSFNQPIGGWTVSNVTDMGGMFDGASSFNQAIGGWDVSSVAGMTQMFANATSFNQAIGGWDVSNVTRMGGMFVRATSFNQAIGAWDVSKVTIMRMMFAYASGFNQGIGAWDVSNVTLIAGMFYGASSFNQDISDWDVSNITNMWGMFYGASSFNRDIGDWDVSNVTDMANMFRDAASFNQDLSGWCVSLITEVPAGFDTGATSWLLPRPVWGTCPTDPLSDPFITTWNTNLAEGTTVTLALAGTVNATIDWGDGTVTTVTTPGPHVHDYGTEGTYTVSVTGSVTAYNSFSNGGAVSERHKLLSVDSWGQVGFTSLEYAFHSASNLVLVPASTEGIEAVTTLHRMFFGARPKFALRNRGHLLL